MVTSELLLLFRNEGFTHRLEAEVHTVTLRMDYISSYFLSSHLFFIQRWILALSLPVTVYLCAKAFRFPYLEFESSAFLQNVGK